jgi:adenylate cyclase
VAVQLGRQKSRKSSARELPRLPPTESGWRRSSWFNRPVTSPDQSRALALPDKPSIAILPFTNLSGDPAQDYFSNGMTEDLINDASKLSGLFVIAHDSVLIYKGKSVKVQDVGRELGVRYFLEGSVRKAGDEVRISARLMDASNERQLWAQRYDRAVKDTFAVQDDILRHVIADLRVEALGAELDRIGRIPTQSLTAYESYLRGVDLAMRNCAKEPRAQARKLLQRSVDLDPNFAEAYAMLAVLEVQDSVVGVGVLAGVRVRKLVERALVLNESLPIAHIVMANLLPRVGGRREQAIAEADRAMALGPNDADVYVRAAGVYTGAGRPNEAITLIEKAMRLNPRYPVWYLYFLGCAYAVTERYEEALAAQKKVVLAQPDILPSHIELAAIYRKLGRQEEATAEEAEIRRLNPEIPVDLEEYVDGEPQTSPTASRSAEAFIQLR